MTISLHDKQVGDEVTLLIDGDKTSSLLQVYVGSTLSSLPVVTLLLPSGVTTSLKFTPTSNGVHTLLVDGAVYAVVDCVGRSLASYLRNIEDEALGSWVWDKVAGTLQLLRQDGSALANFAVADTQTNSSRERLL